MSKAFIVVGLGFGDEGKGTVVDYLTRQYNAKLIVRFNGGPQAAHHVVTRESVTHAFSQFGSGTFIPGVKTYISSHTVIDPLSLILEDAALQEKGVFNATKRLLVNKDCLIVTPFHKIINRIIETARREKHGTCGKGVGEAVKDGKNLKEKALRFNDLFDKSVLAHKLKFIWHLKVDLAEQILADKINSAVPNTEPSFSHLIDIKKDDYVEWLTETYYEFAKTSGITLADKYFDMNITKFDEEANVIFEGAQGILLDEENGFFPYVTHSNTTFKNAEDLLLSSGFCGDIIKIGVLRPYFTRHGMGPFVTEDSELAGFFPEIHNEENKWQGKMRIGWFDFIAAKYALDVAGKIDYLAITNIDRLNALSKIKFCHSYEYQGKITNYDEFSELFHWGRCHGQIFITNIRTDTKAAVKYKGKLAEHLKKCAPYYRNYYFSNDGKKVAINKYVKYIEERLGMSIGIFSYGPTAFDKTCWIN